MKTVSGNIVSTKPVKLSKAANIMSNFVNSDNGASQAVSAYLRRASAAFDELVYFKRHYKMKKSQPTEETSTRSDISTRYSEEQKEVRVLEIDGVNRKFQNLVEVDEKETRNDEGRLRKKEKKKKKLDDGLGSEKNNNIEVEFEQGEESVKKNNNIEVEFEQGEETVKEKKKKKKKIDNGLGSEKNYNIEVDFEQGDDSVKEKSEDKKKKKKRKNVEVDVGDIGNPMEPERKKKKRRVEAAQ